MPEPNPKSRAIGIGLGLGFGPEHEREYDRRWRSPSIVLPPLPASVRCARPDLGEGRAQRTEAGRQR